MAKPIETLWNGYRFRSRLEARWAVFLSNIGWNWEYEPEGYELDHGTRYLPDFIIRAGCSTKPLVSLNPPDPVLWLEVKPCYPSHDEWKKARLLSFATGMPVTFCVGVPDPERITCLTTVFCNANTKLERSKLIPDEWEVEVTTASLTSYSCAGFGEPQFCVFDEEGPEDVAACDAAKSARFEFGESPERI